MGLRTVKKKHAHKEAGAPIRRRITEGRWTGRDGLQAERDFDERFQVSRASVRGEMRALKPMGFVRIRIGKGTFVASNSEPLFSTLVSSILTQHTSLADIFEIRKVGEPEIHALAARRATAMEIGCRTS